MAVPGEALIAGVDEAGRGCVIGPLVIAGVCIPKAHENKLKELGVKDSKELTQKKRAELSEKIEAIAKDVFVVKVGPCKIDTYRKQGIGMNRIEAIKFADIIKMLSPHTAYIDAPDPNIDKYSRFLNRLTGDQFKLVLEHKADQNYPVVSAASIIAKAEREIEIAKHKEQYGDFGSGYTSDECTVNWLRNWLKDNKEFPEGLVRKSWMTSSILKAEKEQRDLGGWFRGIIRKDGVKADK